MNRYANQLKEEYETRIRVLERSVHGEKERRRQLGFRYRQLEAQLKKVKKDNDGLEKKLKSLKKCASCSHLDLRSKSCNALNELLHGSVPLLEPEAVASISSRQKNNGFKLVELANNNLQHCVDKLQNMLKEKGREAIANEKYYNEAVLERERKITELQNELAMLRNRETTQTATINQHAEGKLKALLKERNELLNRIHRLENENKKNHITISKETQYSVRPANTLDFDDNINPYCEYCRNKVKSWNKMMNGTEKIYSGFMSGEAKNLNYSMREVDAVEKEIQKLSLALETEKVRNEMTEKALKNKYEMLLTDYQKLQCRNETLEIELGKRRAAELNAKDRSEHNEAAASIINDKTVQQKNELGARYATSQLNQKCADLERQKRELVQIIESQKTKSLMFEEEMRILKNEKGALQQKCTELERSNSSAVKEKLELLAVIEILRKEISYLEERQNESNKAYDAQVESYQQLIKQKDGEYEALLAEFCAASRPEVPLYDPIAEMRNRNVEVDENRELLKELRELNHEKQLLSNEITRLDSELKVVKEQLKCKSEEVEKEVVLKNSMHDDLAKARTLLLEREAQFMDLNNALKVADVKIMKIETELANATDRLEIEKSTAKTLKETVEELEDMLQEKNSELIAAAQERQRCACEMQKIKELKYDLETKLTLQGRELKEAREKLAALRKKIRELENEAANSTDNTVPARVVQMSTKSMLTTAKAKSSTNLSNL